MECGMKEKAAGGELGGELGAPHHRVILRSRIPGHEDPVS